MRRMANCHVSPALLHVRTPSVPRVDASRLKKKVRRMGEVEAEAVVVVVVVAAVGRSYREGARGKIRPDSSRHPMGRNLSLKKLIETVMWNVISLAFFPPISFCLTFPRYHLPHNSITSAPRPPLYPKRLGPGWAVVWFGKVVLGISWNAANSKKTIFVGSAGLWSDFRGGYILYGHYSQIDSLLPDV